jgi:sodium transport system permease protein
MMIGSALGYMVILFLFMFTGALYPAIDMTAGEKERRTLEAVLSSPASRMTSYSARSWLPRLLRSSRRY